MKLKRVLPFAKDLLLKSLEWGDTAIDATAGNGYDTVFLAELVGEKGHVYSFDVQQAALDATDERLGDLKSRVSLILDGHENIANYVQQEVAGAIFNLGYLPGSDHTVITKGETTIAAIEGILNILKVGGVIVLVVYYGHVGGKDEKDALMSYVSSLPQSYAHVMKYEFLNQQNDPPFVIAIEKMKASINL